MKKKQTGVILMLAALSLMSIHVPFTSARNSW